MTTLVLARDAARRQSRLLAAGALAAALIAVLLVALPGARPADAAITTPFQQAFSVNTNGTIQIRGNTLLTCQTATAGCPAARAWTSAQAPTNGTDPQVGDSLNNNGFTAAYVDVDADATTFNSSTARLDVPAGGNVLYAALVWGAGTAAPTPALRNQVSFRAPGAAGYSTVVADDFMTRPDGSFQGFTDVTDEIAAAGSGAYTVANVQVSAGSSNRHAGWALVVVMADPAAPARNLTVYRGFGDVSASAGNQTVDLTVDGFITPPSGPVRTELGMVSYEGDAGSVGDQLLLRSGATAPFQNVADARNARNNVFNSSLTERGAETPGRDPAYPNQLGFDADVLRADGILANSATNATIRLTTTSETYYPGVVTFATELYDPTLLGSKQVTNVTAGSPIGTATSALPGDVLEYTVPAENIGLDTASDSTFFDAVPVGTTYVPGSLSVDGVAVTDQPGDDTGEFVADANQGHVVARLGAGATTAEGGSIPADGGATKHTVRFRVVVDADAQGQDLTNVAAYTYRGQTTGAAQSTASNSVVGTVPSDPSANTEPSAPSYIRTLRPAPGSGSLVLDVLAASTDTDGDTLTLLGATDGAGGAVVVDAQGRLVYTPRPDFAGRDAFTYTISDGRGGTSTAVVRVDVVNDAPTADDETASTPAGSPVAVDVLAGDTDANGDSLTVKSFPSATANGTVTQLPDGRLQYTPNPGFRGTDSFEYVVEDTRGGTDTGLVTITVTNRAPDAVDDAVVVQQGTTPVPLAVRGNDSDPDGDVTTVSAYTQPGSGSVVLAPNGTGSWTPPAGFVGTTTFTYTLTDGSASDTATVTLTVNGPPVAATSSATTATNTARQIDLLAGSSDPNGDTVTVASVTQPAAGSVVLGAGGVATYTPPTGFTGTTTFDYVLTDGRGGSTTRTVTVTVTNAAPVAADLTAGTATDVAAEVDVLAHASDLNNQPTPTQTLTVVPVSATGGATLSVNADGELVVTPATGFKGTVVATYRVSDGTDESADATVTLTVANGAPVTDADGPVSTPTSTSVLVDVLDGDVDPNGDTLSLTGVFSTPADSQGHEHGTVAVEGGQVRYTPPTGWAGTVTFTYEVTDGTTTSTGTATVVVENAVPVAADLAVSTATDEPVTVDVLTAVLDPNIGHAHDQELVVSAATADNGASVVVDTDGALVVTPADGFKGTVTVTYTVSDGVGGIDEGTVTVTVRNAAPVVTAAASASTPTDVEVLVDVLADVDDANGDTLSVGALGAPVDADGTVRGTVVVEGGQVRYAPPAGFAGTVTFTYEVTDGTDTVVATATVTVLNATPVTAPDTATTVAGRSVVVDVLANDGDQNVPGTDQELTVVAWFADNGATVTTDPQGRLVVTPAPGFVGVVTVTYTVADGAGGTATGTLRVTVTAAGVGGGGTTAPTTPGTTPGSGGTGAGGTGSAGTGSGGANGQAAAASRLPRTGADGSAALAGIALTSLLLGAGLVLTTRRRRAA